MANPTTTTPTPQPKSLPIDNAPPDLGEEPGQEADADDSAFEPREDDTGIEDGDPGRVEIGDPVPEEDRTVRAGEEQLPVDEDDPDLSVDPDPDPSTERH